MAGVSASGKPPTYEVTNASGQEQSLNSASWNEITKEIYQRTLVRNQELSLFEESEKKFRKMLDELRTTFGPLFNYANLLGVDYADYVTNKSSAAQIRNKDKHVDLLFVFTTRVGSPIKQEGKTTTFQSTNGTLSVHDRKIEFVAGDEPVVEGKKPKKKSFELDDAINLVLLARMDRNMSPPNKMKFNGSRRERALMHEALEWTNKMFPKEEQFKAADRAPFLITQPIPKQDRDLFATLNANLLPMQDIPADSWKREEKAKPKAEEKKGDDPQNSGNDPKKPDPTDQGPKDPDPAGPKDGGNDPTQPKGTQPQGQTEAEAPAPENSGEDDDIPEGAPFVEKGKSTLDVVAEAAPDTSSQTEKLDASRVPTHTRLDTPDHISAAKPTMDHQNLSDAHKDVFPQSFVGATESEAVDDAPQADVPILQELDSETVAAREETILSAVAETGEMLSKEQQDGIAQADMNRQAQRMMEHVEILTGRLEKMFAGQPAHDAISAILKSYEEDHNLSHKPEYVDVVIKQLERDQLIVRNPNNGDTLFRGLATMKDHGLEAREQADYDVISKTIMTQPQSFMGTNESSLAAQIKAAIESDSLFETKGYGHKLSATAREDFANGIAKRVMGYLKEDNVVQLGKDGNISFIARPAPSMTQSFHQAAAQPQQQPPQSQPAPMQRPAEQTRDSMYVPVNVTFGQHTFEGFEKVSASAIEPQQHKQQPQAPAQETTPKTQTQPAPEAKPKIRIPGGNFSDKDAMQAIESGQGRIGAPHEREKIIISGINQKPVSDFFKEIGLIAMPDDERMQDIIERQIYADCPDLEPMDIPTPTPEELGFKPVGKSLPVTREIFAEATTMTIPKQQPAPYQEGDIEKQLLDIIDQGSNDSVNAAPDNSALGRMVDRVRARHNTAREDAPKVAAQ